MSELLEGCLAIVVGDGLNLGKIVHLLEHHTMVKFDDGDIWEDVWLIEGKDLINTYYCTQQHVLIKSNHLKPIGDVDFLDELCRVKAKDNKNPHNISVTG